jgi:hypothetical protein
VADVVSSPVSVPAAAGQAFVQEKSNPAPTPRPIPDPQEVRVRARKPTPPPEPEVEYAEEVEEKPVKPVRSRSKREEGISTRPVRHKDVETEDEEEETKGARRPRRLKRRRPKERPKSLTPGGWGFIRWVAVTMVYAFVGTGYAAYMITHDHVPELILNSIYWAVMMPVGLVIFVASMFIGSAVAGGIDFGDAFTAIPKAIFLLAPINFIYAVVPIGMAAFFFALPFWIVGLILLYGLDVWEAKFIIVINWLLGKGAGMLILLIVVAMIHGATMDKDKDKNSPDSGDDDPMGAPFQKDPPKLRLRR